MKFGLEDEAKILMEMGLHECETGLGVTLIEFSLRSKILVKK